MKLWHDDVRPAPEGWVHARTNAEAIRILLSEDVEEASLDHDLGYNGPLGSASTPETFYVAGESEDDGTKLAEWLARHPALMPKRINIHSWNDAGRRRMYALLREAAPPDVVITVRAFDGTFLGVTGRPPDLGPIG